MYAYRNRILDYSQFLLVFATQERKKKEKGGFSVLTTRLVQSQERVIEQKGARLRQLETDSDISS